MTKIPRSSASTARAILSVLPLLLFGTFDLSPHDLMGRSATDFSDYQVPHEVTVTVPPHPPGGIFSVVQDMPQQERDLVETDARRFIQQRRWTSEQITLVRPATKGYDCHGLTFDLGRSTIGSEFAEDLARYAGFSRLPVCRTLSPDAGDIVLYRIRGRVTHSGLVVGTRGTVVRVLSKWGQWPEFVHDIDKVPENYGMPEFWHKCSGN